MALETLRQTLAQADGAALWIGLVTGFLFSFNPVALTALPVALAYVTKAHALRRAVFCGGLFILGMIITHAVLGLIAGLGGSGVQHLLGRAWGLVLGPLLILLGLSWPGWIRLPLPALSMRAKPATTAWGAFLLGIPFSVAVCPFCTPALVVMLGVAAASGSPAYGVILLLAFALGRAIPILLGAIAIGWLERLNVLSRSQNGFEVAGGVVLIISGIYLLWSAS